MDNRSDKELALAACQEDRTAYAVLVRRHYQPVFLVCLGILGKVHDAEDVAQDSMIRGFQQIRQLRDGSQFAGWIVAIARNLSINVLRRRRIAPKAPSAEESSRRDTPVSDYEDLQQAVARLPWDLRLPLVMYYFDGQNVKTVAERLRISTSGVYQKLRAATRELHAILTTRGDTP